MGIQQEYMSLPYDLAGSRSKNRFRLELLWGVSKMLDLLESDKDFVMVFDYVCDIEVHYNDGFEFYQIKTHNGKGRSYTSKSLTKKSTEKAQGSILGKLYMLDDQNGHTKLAIVSNVKYSVEKKLIDEEEWTFANLDEKEQSKLKTALQEELGIDTVDFSNVYFIHTDMNLKNPENEIQGKIVINFQKIKKCEPQKPHALYQLIFSTVSEKACYEFSINDYDDLLKYKGITRSEFNRLLDVHAINERTGIQQTQDYIDSVPDIILRKKYKAALAQMISIIPKAKDLHVLENRIAAFLINADELGDTAQALRILVDNFHDDFHIEYSHEDKMIFYLIILNKYEEGVYEDENVI